MFPSRLMLCIDDPRKFDLYAEEVGWLARRLQTDLVLYHAWRPGLADLQPSEADHREEDRAFESLAKHPALAWLNPVVECAESVLDVVDHIHETAERQQADLVVVPTHARRGLRRLVFGSVAERVLRACRTPVLTFDIERAPRDPDAAPFDRVIAPVDFSEHSLDVAREAALLADRLGRPVTYVHVVSPESAAPEIDPDAVTEYHEKVVLAARRALRRQGDEHARRVGFDVRVDTGKVVEVILDEADRHRNPLIVMCTAGHDSLGDGVLGSRTERCVRGARGSVLTLPPAWVRGRADSAGRSGSPASETS